MLYFCIKYKNKIHFFYRNGMKQLPYHEVAVGYDAVSGGVGRACA